MHPGEVMVAVLVLFGIVGGIGYSLSIYNGLVALKNNIARSWANIDVLLKQRHDELPKLIKVCEGYMQHERAVFDKLSEARGALSGAKTVGQRAEAENMLTRALGQFFAVAEAYPDLKANQNMLQLSEEITSTENKVAFSRQAYNDAVTAYNTYKQTFPPVLIAGIVGHGQNAELLQFEDAAKIAEAPKVSFT